MFFTWKINETGKGVQQDNFSLVLLILFFVEQLIWKKISIYSLQTRLFSINSFHFYFFFCLKTLLFRIKPINPIISKVITIKKNFYTRKRKTFIWQLWDSNPRPFGLVPKTSALDHSAKLPYSWHNSQYD